MYTSVMTRLFGVAIALAALSAAPAWAQGQPASSSIGPGRITCRSATACELDIGTPPSLRYRVDPTALAAPDKDRLTKQCTAKGTPCIATVNGTENKGTVKAASIKFYN